MGAGKTTLHRHAVQRLVAAGRPVRMPRVVSGGYLPLSRLRRLVFKLRVSWRSRRLVIVALRHLLASGRPRKDILKGLRWFLTDLGNHWTARLTASDQIILLDEGLVQRMFNVLVHGYGAIDLAGIKDYARALPLPDVLIYVVANPDVAMSRTQSRSSRLSRRFRKLKDTQLESVFAGAARALDVLVNEIRATAPQSVNIIVIDTSDFETAKKKFSAMIDPILMMGDGPDASVSARPAAPVAML